MASGPDPSWLATRHYAISSPQSGCDGFSDESAVIQPQPGNGQALALIDRAPIAKNLMVKVAVDSVI